VQLTRPSTLRQDLARARVAPEERQVPLFSWDANTEGDVVKALQSASEIVEAWCRKVYATNHEKGRDAAKKVSFPQDALRVRSHVLSLMGETAKDVSAVIDHIDECGAASEAEGDMQQELRDAMADLRLQIDQMHGLDPFSPREVYPGGEPMWEPTGCSGIAYALNSRLAGCLRWLSLNFPAAAEVMKQSLDRLTAATEEADAPMRRPIRTPGRKSVLNGHDEGNGSTSRKGRKMKVPSATDIELAQKYFQQSGYKGDLRDEKRAMDRVRRCAIGKEVRVRKSRGEPQADVVKALSSWGLTRARGDRRGLKAVVGKLWTCFPKA
jgi:hypothetical protein